MNLALARTAFRDIFDRPSGRLGSTGVTGMAPVETAAICNGAQTWTTDCLVWRSTGAAFFIRVCIVVSILSLRLAILCLPKTRMPLLLCTWRSQPDGVLREKSCAGQSSDEEDEMT